jgi:hypothetical protein
MEVLEEAVQKDPAEKEVLNLINPIRKQQSFHPTKRAHLSKMKDSISQR